MHVGEYQFSTLSLDMKNSKENMIEDATKMER
jgi:hypothetical protein